ncbi:PAS domain S-box protein, partial [bacterium]|nr:PAS domain S-box protein [bacterium]
IENSLQGVLISQDYKVIYANKALEDITGYPLEKLTTFSEKDVKEIIHQDDLLQIRNEYLKIIEGEVYRAMMDIRIFHASGELRWLEITGGKFFHNNRPAVQAFIMDVTDRKIMEDALKHSEAQLRTIFEKSTIGFYRTHPDGKILFVNKAVLDMLGFESIEELTARNLDSEGFESGYSREQFKEIIERDGVVRGYENFWVRLDGKRIYVRESARKVTDDDGKTLYYEGTVEDITDRKFAEEEISRSQQKIQDVLESINDCFFTLDKDLRFSYTNSQANSDFGVKGMQLIGEEFWNHFPNSLKYVLDPIFERVLSEKVVETFEEYVEEKHSWMSGRVYPLTGGVSVILRDVSNRKFADELLHTREEEFRALAENAPDIIARYNRDFEYIYVNPIIENYLGIPHEEIIGKKNEDLYIPDHLCALFRDNMELTFNTAKNHIIEFDLPTPVGLFYFETRYVPEYSRTGNIDSILAISRDLTDRHNAETQIRESLEEKEVLLREIHHRVKNNFQVISSLLDIQSYAVTDKEAAKVLLESRNRIRTIALVHEKLYQMDDLSKINYSDYLNSLVFALLYAHHIDPESIRLEMDFDPIYLPIGTAIPCSLLVNELVSNSLRHAFAGTKDGYLKISFLRLNRKNVKITIADNGPGLPADIDLNNAQTLGLKLVNMFVDQLDGALQFKHEGGTMFEIVIPLEETKKKTQKAAKSQNRFPRPDFRAS